MGIIKAQSGDFKGSIKLFDKSISLVSNDNSSFYQRGLAKYKIGEKSGACNDINKANELGHFLAQEWLSKNCK